VREHRLRLRDGRALCCAEFGDPAGAPVFYFHGFPGSRLEAATAATAAADRRVRLIAVDRPGYGGSDFAPGRRIGDFADDVAQAATALGLPRFSALGVSGGGPYLLACARTLAPRLVTAGIFCGLGPLDRPDATEAMTPFSRLALGLGRRAPGSARLLAVPVAAVLRRWPERVVDHLAKTLPEPDRAVLADPALRPLFAASYRESVRGGARGPAHDLMLYTRPWGFGLDEIPLPVHLWHGERDTVVPASIARAQQRALRDCRARFFPGEAHFSVVARHLRAMLDLLRDGGV